MTQENLLGLHDLLAGSAHYSHLLRKLMVSGTEDISCLNDVLTAVTKCPGKKLKQEGFTLLWSSWGVTVHSGQPAWWECRELAGHIVSSLRKQRKKRTEEPSPKASPTPAVILLFLQRGSAALPRRHHQLGTHHIQTSGLPSVQFRITEPCDYLSQFLRC